jgi:hypothetical protein
MGGSGSVPFGIMTGRDAWRDGWTRRLRYAIEELGFASVREFAIREAGVPLGTIVTTTLRSEFAPIQLAIVMGVDAIREGWADWFAKDLLVRTIREYCPDGWSGHDTRDFDRAHAIGVWVAIVKDLGIWDPGVARSAGERLLRVAPPGWEPGGPDDGIIEDALA